MKKNIIKIKIAIFVFAFLTLSDCQAIASSKYRWEFAGWYGGGCYPNIEFDPNIKDRVYLTSDVTGIWRSDDLGENWNYINKDLGCLNVALVAIAKSNSHIIYAGTLNGLYLSKNAGISWRPCGKSKNNFQFDRPDNYRSIAISDIDPREICIGTAKGEVYYSKDFGENWISLGGQKNPFGYGQVITAVNFDRKGDIFISSYKGMAKFSFVKKEWAFLKNGPKEVKDFLINKRIYAVGKKYLFISSDNGESWLKIRPIIYGSISRVAVSEYNAIELIAIAWERNWQGGIITSSNGGKNWVEANNAMENDIKNNPTRLWSTGKGGSRVTSIKINPFDQNVLYRTDWWGIWRSDDCGKSWREKIKGAPNTYGSDIIVNKNNDIFVATMDGGLCKSSDGGASYVAIFPKIYRKNIAGHIWRVSTFGKDFKNIIATSSPWGDNVNQILISNDGGDNFNIVRSGLPKKRPKINTMWVEGYARALAVDPYSPNNIYLGIDGNDGGGFFISRDGGNKWTRPANQPGSVRIFRALAVDPNDTNRIFWGSCGEKGGIYLSEDKGSTWKYIFDKVKWIFEIVISKKGVIYFGGDENGPVLYSSYDNGNTWKILGKFPGRGAVAAICINQNDPKTIAISSNRWDGNVDANIYITHNGGYKWTEISGDLPPGTGAAAMAFSNDGKFLYILKYAGSVYKTKI